MSLNRTGIEWTHCFGPGTGCAPRARGLLDSGVNADGP